MRTKAKVFGLVSAYKSGHCSYIKPVNIAFNTLSVIVMFLYFRSTE